jgi:hypothetical protein
MNQLLSIMVLNPFTFNDLINGVYFVFVFDFNYNYNDKNW